MHGRDTYNHASMQHKVVMMRPRNSGLHIVARVEDRRLNAIVALTSKQRKFQDADLDPLFSMSLVITIAKRSSSMTSIGNDLPTLFLAVTAIMTPTTAVAKYDVIAAAFNQG